MDTESITPTPIFTPGDAKRLAQRARAHQGEPGGYQLVEGGRLIEARTPAGRLIALASEGIDGKWFAFPGTIVDRLIGQDPTPEWTGLDRAAAARLVQLIAALYTQAVAR